jgi:hypothetical protein
MSPTREEVLHCVFDTPMCTADQIRIALGVTPSDLSRIGAELLSAERSGFVRRHRVQGQERWSPEAGLDTVLTVVWRLVGDQDWSFLRTWSGRGALFEDAESLAAQLRQLAGGLEHEAGSEVQLH